MDSLPSAIGRYEVKAFIARGGMGTLYLARDPVLHRQVAIKLLREADNDELRTRFTREARSAANLRHRNIVTIFDVGDYNNQPFMAMEYIQGQTLGALIAGDPPPSIIRRLELIEELCDGLAYAHRQGVVHRDVKPANLMVDAEGTLKILDFGIARAAAESGMTQAGLLVGTLNYMSPEQVAGTAIDGRSDMFAVGAVMYELLARRQAFPGSIDSGVLNRILSGEPEPLDAIFPHLDPAISDIVRTALQKRPADRYADLQQMRIEVQQARRALEDSVQPEFDPTVVVLADQTTRATPTPSRRGTDRDEIARRRAQQIEAHVAAAKQALEEGHYDDAIKYCEDVLLIDPNESRALDMSDRARLKRDEAGARDWVSQARQHLKGGDLTSASNCVKEALELIPNSSDALEMSRLIGEARLAQERERQRAAAIEEALTRGRAALGRGEPEAAIAAAAEALALAPGHDDARRLREEAQQAIEARERAAREAEAQETVDEARRLFAEGQHEDALSVLEQFWPAHPKVSHAWTELSAERTRIEAEREARTLNVLPPTITSVSPPGSRNDDPTVFIPRGPASEPPLAQTPPPVVDRTIAAPPASPTPSAHTPAPVVDRTIAPAPPPATPAPTSTLSSTPAPVARKDPSSDGRAEPVTRGPSPPSPPSPVVPPPSRPRAKGGDGTGRSRTALYGGLAALILIALFGWLMFGGGRKDGKIADNLPTTTLVPPSTAPPSTASIPPVTSTTTTLPAPSTTTSTTTTRPRATSTTTTTMQQAQITTTTLSRPTTTVAPTTTTTTTTLAPTTTSTTVAPTTTLPRVIVPQVNEQQAIERMLNQYAAAFGRKDIPTISRLHPSIGETALGAIRRSKSFTVDISNIQTSVAPNGTTATVTATVKTENRPEAGATQKSTVSTQFQLEKHAGGWIIAGRRGQ